MKGIVVEIRNKDAIVLSDEGSVVKIKNNNYNIGEEVETRDYNRKLKVKLIALAAGLIISFIGVGGGAYAYNTPSSYVSLDVNPSIEYSVNTFNRVINATGMNEDGEAVLARINVKNQTIDEAIKETVSEIGNQGYIKEGEIGSIILSTSSENADKAKELADRLKVDTDEVINERNLVAEVEAINVSRERIEEAKVLGVTPGKLILVEKLQKSVANPNDISAEEWINKPVKEIMKEIKVNSTEQKAKAEEDINKVEERKDNSNKVKESEDVKLKDKVDTEKKNANENVDKNQNKDVNNTSVEKKDTDTNSNENKSKNSKSNAEINNKKNK